MIQSATVTLQPGARAAWTFFGLYEPDHPEASSDADLARIDEAQQASGDFAAADVALSAPVRSLLQDAPPVVARSPRRDAEIAERYPERAARGTRRRTAGLVLRARWRAQPPRRAARQGADGDAPARGPAAHRPGHAARRDDAVRHLLDARRVRRAAHDRQHVLPQALLGLARPLQHHPRERAAHPDRRGRGLAAARGAVGLRDRPQRLPLDLPAGRTGPSRCGRSRRRRAGDAVARRRRGRALPLPRVRPPGAGRARARPRAAGSRSTPPASAFAFRPDPASLWGQRYPEAVYHLVTGTPDAIEAIGGDELLYADGTAARRRLTWRCGRGRRASSASPSWAR